MRKDLIRTLLKEFEKDKEVIEKNLLLAMNEIILEASDEYEKAVLTIKIERKGSVKNGKCMGKNEKK